MSFIYLIDDPSHLEGMYDLFLFHLVEKLAPQYLLLELLLVEVELDHLAPVLDLRLQPVLIGRSYLTPLLGQVDHLS